MHGSHEAEGRDCGPHNEGQARRRRFCGPSGGCGAVRFRSGGNTLLVECALDQVAPAVPGTISVTFHNPNDGKQLTDLVLDIDKR